MFAELIAECREIIENVGQRTRKIKPLSTAQQIKQAQDVNKAQGSAEQHKSYDLGGSGAIFTQQGAAQRFKQSGKGTQHGHALRHIGQGEIWKRSRS